MTSPLIGTSYSEDQTFALGAAIGRTLRGGDFLALSGPLGAGKTRLVQGLAAGLGVPPDEPVVSPTFVLIREYPGRLTLYHVDAYRLSGPAELLALGLDELAAQTDAVVAVEWADRARPAIPGHACWIDLDHAGPTARRIALTCSDPDRHAALAAALAATLTPPTGRAPSAT